MLLVRAISFETGSPLGTLPGPPSLESRIEPANAPQPGSQVRGLLRSCWPYLLITLVVLLLRWPTLSDRIYSIDEPAYIAEAARLQSFGAFVYSFDYQVETKTQVSLIPYLVARALSAEHAILVAHLLGLLAVLASCYLLVRLTRRFLGSTLPGLAAALIWVPFLEVGPGYALGGHTTLETYPAPKLEYFQLPFILASLYLFAWGMSPRTEHARQRIVSLFAAGATWAISILVKPSTVLLGLLYLVLLIYLVTRPRVDRMRAPTPRGQVLVFILGAVLPLAAIALPYLFNPAAQADLSFTITQVVPAYSAASPGSPIIRLLALLLSGMPPLTLLAFLVLPIVVRWRRREPLPTDKQIVLTLAAGFAPLLLLNSVPGCTCPYYLITVVPFMALTVTGYLDLGLRDPATRGRQRRAVLSLALLVILSLSLKVPALVGFPAAASTDSYRAEDEQRFDLARLAAYIQTHSRPTDQIWVYYNAPELYLWTDRLPATRDPQGIWLSVMDSDPWFQHVAADLVADRPQIIVGLDQPRLARAVARPFHELPYISIWITDNYDCQSNVVRGAVVCLHH